MGRVAPSQSIRWQRRCSSSRVISGTRLIIARSDACDRSLVLAVTDRPTVIDFLVEQKENCWPMIAPGKPHYEMLGTYEMLSKDGGVAQHRRATPDEESKLSLG